jgi:hypothetical protein
MEYVNPHGVRFRIKETRNTPEFVARYYTPNDKWPRTYRTFTCSSEEKRREMFFMINNVRLCSTCTTTILDYRIDPDQTICTPCNLRRDSLPEPDDIPECPVCFQKMLDVDSTRKTLACKHHLCMYCFHRMHRTTHFLGPYAEPVGKLTCPLCRHEAYYSRYTFKPVDGRGLV